MGDNTNTAPATEVKVEEKPIGKRELFRREPVILVATANPKKPGSMSYDRFQGYFDIDWEKPQTVGSVLDGRVVRMDDIRHDSEHGSIVIGAENIKAHMAKKEADEKAALEAARALVAKADKSK